jgi:MFS family permease
MNEKKGGFFDGITRNIYILGFVSLFTDLSSQMVFPLIPLFLTSVLKVGAFAVGLVEGGAEATASLLKVVSGYWSDKVRRRKPFVMLGYSMSSLTKPLFAFATVWPLVLGIRVLERIGKGLRSAPRDAIVAESVDESVIGKAFGFQRTLDGLGSVLGAVLAFLLLPVLGFKGVFLFAFIPGIITIFILFFIQEKGVPARDDSKKMSVKHSFGELPGSLKLFIVVSAIFALGHFGYAFLLLKAQNIGLADEKAILLYVLFYIVYTFVSMPIGALSDKIGRRPILMMSYLLFAIISAGLMLSSRIYGVVIFFAIYGIFYSMLDCCQRAFVADLAPKHLKATAMGAFHTAIGLVALPAGFIAGTLWDKIRPEATFLYGLILAVVAFLLFLFVKTIKAEKQKA